MNFDGPYQLFPKVFKQDMGEYWLDHNLADKVMFGSDSPRIRPVRSKRGLDSVEMLPETREKIYWKMQCAFWMGGPEQMRFELKEVSICAEKEFELIRITDPVREFVAQTGVKNGVVYVITEHTTTGIMVNESLPCVERILWRRWTGSRRKTILTITTTICPPTAPSAAMHPAISRVCSPGTTAFSDRRGQDQAGQRSGYLFLRVRWHQNRKYMIYVMGE